MGGGSGSICGYGLCFLSMSRRPPRSTQSWSSAASDVYKLPTQYTVECPVSEKPQHFVKVGSLSLRFRGFYRTSGTQSLTGNPNHFFEKILDAKEMGQNCVWVR